MSIRLHLLPVIVCAGLGAQESPVPSAAKPEVKPPVTPSTTERQGSPLHLSLLVDGGYDSNVLLLPDTASGTAATRQGSADLGAEGRLDWQAWQSRQGSVRVGANFRQDTYADAPIKNNRHYGANLVAAWMNEDRTLIPALSASANRYQLDGVQVADDGFTRLSLARRSRFHVDVAAVDMHRVSYDDASLEDRSGVLWAGGWRHWFLVEENSPDRRLELGLRAGRYLANEEWQTYTTLRPDLAGVWRFGPPGDSGSLRLTASSGLEWRRSPTEMPGYEEPERQLLWDVQAQLAYTLGTGSSVGPFAGFTRRLDNLDDRTYNRWVAGVRILVTIP